MIFGRKKDKENRAPANSRITSLDPRSDPNLIRVFDKFGREAFIDKEKWRTDVLPGTIKTVWNDAEQLYAVIVSGLRDGFFQDIREAARHLLELDPASPRAVCAYGIILMKVNQSAKAESVFLKYLQHYGNNGSVLANLAKVFADRGENSKAEETLWTGLECDPNQDNGMHWYVAIHRERGGEPAALAALRRLAAIAGSWRAQLWIARAALDSGDLGEAVNQYRGCLAHFGREVPSDFLMQMSGDLGNHKHLSALLELTEPNFVASLHGLAVGNNLIKAHLDLGEIDAAKTILNELYSLKRPDWNPQLSFWDAEIAKKRISVSSQSEVNPTEHIEAGLLAIEGPVWLPAGSPALSLFDGKTTEEPSIGFLGSSAAVSGEIKLGPQMPNLPGRFSRAMPLFLAEEVWFASKLNAVTFVPWIKGTGFLLSGVAWRDEDAMKYSLMSPTPPQYLITSHLDTQKEPWELSLRLLRLSDHKCLATLQTTFDSTSPEAAIRKLSFEFIEILSIELTVKFQRNNAAHQVPKGEAFGNYLLRLEQLLAVRCTRIEGTKGGFLNGERDIVNAGIQLCLECPENIGTRVMLAQTLLAMKRVRPDVSAEFKDRVLLLQKEMPLPRAAQDTVNELLYEAFGMETA